MIGRERVRSALVCICGRRYTAKACDNLDVYWAQRERFLGMRRE